MIHALLLALLACGTPQPSTEAPAPEPAPEAPTAAPTPKPVHPSAPGATSWQALGLFWPSLQALPAGPVRPAPPGSVPAAAGCIATGRHAVVAQLPAEASEPWRPVLPALASLLAGDPAAAAEPLERAVADAPEHPLVRTVQAHAAIVAGEHERGAALLAPVVTELTPLLGDTPPLTPVEPPGPCGASVEPTPFTWWLAELGLAWSAANTGDHLLALEHHQAILAQRHRDRMASLGAGLALMNLDRIDEALAVVQPLATVWPSDPLVLAELEVLISRQRQDADAEASWARELARAGEPNTCPYEGLGLTYLAQGRTQEAREQLEKSVEVDPELGFRKYNGLARIHMDEGDWVRARAMLDRSLANHPDNAEARELSASLARLEAEAATP